MALIGIHAGRKTFICFALACGTGITIRIIRRWCDTGQLENASHEKCRKASIMHCIILKMTIFVQSKNLSIYIRLD